MIPLTTARQITEDKLKELRPTFQKRVRDWLCDCEAAGLVIFIYEGLRSCKRQDELYAKGRTAPGVKVTNAKVGQSMHQYRLAIDFVPLVPSKAAGMWSAAWDTKDEASLYAKAHEIAARHKLRRLTWETPHLEDANYADWKAAMAAFGDPLKP